MNDKFAELSRACVASEGAPIRKSLSPRSATEVTNQGQGQCDADPQCASEAPYPHFRNVIDRLIDYHNRQSNNLHALLRALPQDMSRDSMQALYDLAKNTLGKI